MSRKKKKKFIELRKVFDDHLILAGKEKERERTLIFVYGIFGCFIVNDELDGLADASNCTWGRCKHPPDSMLEERSVFGTGDLVMFQYDFCESSTCLRGQIFLFFCFV